MTRAQARLLAHWLSVPTTVLAVTGVWLSWRYPPEYGSGWGRYLVAAVDATLMAFALAIGVVLAGGCLLLLALAVVPAVRRNAAHLVRRLARRVGQQWCEAGQQ